MTSTAGNLTGECSCGHVRYRITASPLIVHCCHCSWCQRETGSAFAVNALIEKAAVQIKDGTPELVHTPSASGHGQQIARCPKCRVAVWSHYYRAGPNICFIRVGTLDQPESMPPDIHIYTASKQPWVSLPVDAKRSEDMYNPKEVWSPEVLQRFKAASAAQAST